MTIKINNPKSVRKNPQLIFDELIQASNRMSKNAKLCLELTELFEIFLDGYLPKKEKQEEDAKKEKMDL